MSVARPPASSLVKLLISTQPFLELRLSATTSVMGLVLGTPVAAQKCRRKFKGLEMVSVSKMLTTTLALACFS